LALPGCKGQDFIYTAPTKRQQAPVAIQRGIGEWLLPGCWVNAEKCDVGYEHTRISCVLPGGY
jgi:hypothetical protein